MLRPPPRPTLFPYTTLFRSVEEARARREVVPHRSLSRRDTTGDVERQPIVGVRIADDRLALDRKSTRLNSSHPSISYAVFCLKKKIILFQRYLTLGSLALRT